MQTCTQFTISVATLQSFEEECDGIRVNPRIPGRKNSFGMFVSNIENDNKYIDSDEYYSVD